MKISRKVNLSLLILCFLSTTAFITQDEPFAGLLSKLTEYNKNNQQEKVHLHLDKPHYAVGDDIWFKAYVLNTVTTQPSQISNTLYVELINSKDKISKLLRIPMSYGMGWGDFKLADSLPEGNYRIRAYTRWMRNAGSEFFYDKTIKIGRSDRFNSDVAKATKPKTHETNETRISTANKIDLQVFPEGGNLVENIPSKVALKVTGTDGLGKDAIVSIKDQTGAELSQAKTKHMGMGMLVLNPQPGQNYTANISFTDGSSKTIPLPKALPSGYVLSTNAADSSKIGVKIMISQDLIGKGDLSILATHNNNIYYSAKVISDKQVTSLNLPTNKIPSGILRLTLFDPNSNPVAERLVFVNNLSDKLDVQMEGSLTQSTPKAKITSKFKSVHGEKSTPGSFSISVTNASKVEPDELNESNIFTDFLLTSDLSGYIEKPNYYFLKKVADTRSNLDLLLMTQGWRRFVWKDFLNNTIKPVTFQPEKLLVISGTITNYGGKPAAKTKVSLLSTANKLFLIDTLTDENGHFAFKEMFFGDSTKFAVRAETEKGKSNVDIKMDVTPGHVVQKNQNTGNIEININEALASYLTKSDNYFEEMARIGRIKNSINLETVNIIGQKKTVTESTNFNGPGNADYIFTSEEIETKRDLFHALMGRVPGINFRAVRDGVYMPYLNKAQTAIAATSSNFSPMKIIVDGIEIDTTVQPEKINDIVFTEVESIEVLTSGALSFLYGTAGGVIIITSKKGGRDINSIAAAPGTLAYIPEGYYTSREFYMPKYEPNVNNKHTDFRTTIYWKPNLITDLDGQASFEYYNANEPGTYRVVIEGIDAAGNLARKVYNYEVN
jgi:hypothetical protein